MIVGICRGIVYVIHDDDLRAQEESGVWTHQPLLNSTMRSHCSHRAGRAQETGVEWLLIMRCFISPENSHDRVRWRHHTGGANHKRLIQDMAHIHPRASLNTMT